MDEGLFTNWGTKDDERKGIIIEKGKYNGDKWSGSGETRRFKKSSGRKFKPVSTGGYSYGSHYDPKIKVVGGIGDKPLKESERLRLASQGIEFKSKKKDVSQSELEKEAKAAEKAEKKRIKQIEKEANRIARRREKEENKRKKEQAARAKRWKKSYRLSRKSPLASKVRKVIRF